MARSIDTDPLMVANFALMELTIGNNGTNDVSVFPSTKGRSSKNGIFIGFQSISMPEVSVEYQDITEGNWPYPHKVPLTRGSTGDVTITQAVVPTSSDFYVWIFQTLWGRGAPRRHFTIIHLDSGKTKSERQIRLYNCMPVSWTPGSDFDANSAEVSLEALTFNVERIELGLGARAAAAQIGSAVTSLGLNF